VVSETAADSVPVAAPVALAVPVTVTRGEAVAAREGAPDRDAVGEDEGRGDAVSVTLCVAEVESVAEEAPERLTEALRVGEGVPVPVREPVRELCADVEPRGLFDCAGEADGEREDDGEALVDGEALGVLEAAAECEGERLPEGEGDAEPEPDVEVEGVAENVAKEEPEVEGLAEPLGLPEGEGEALLDLLGEAETDGLREPVAEAVPLGVVVARGEKDEDLVRVRVGREEKLAVPERDELWLLDAVAEGEPEPKPDCDAVPLLDGDGEALSEAAAERDTVDEPERVFVAECVSEPRPEAVAEPVSEGLPVAVKEGEVEPVIDDEPEEVLEADEEAESDTDGVIVDVLDSEMVIVGEAEPVADRLGRREEVGVKVAFMVRVARPDCVADREGLDVFVARCGARRCEERGAGRRERGAQTREVKGGRSG
jgi:hypothetical protein